MKPLRRHWWRPAFNRYGAAYLLRWSTHNEGTHLALARSEAQALQLFAGVLRWCDKNDEDTPKVSLAVAGRLVYPPRVYFEAYAEHQVLEELAHYGYWVNTMLDTLVGNGKPLPNGVRVCPEQPGDQYAYHPADECVCGGHKYVGFDYEASYLSGGKERYLTHDRYSAGREETEYDSTAPGVEHAVSGGAPLWGISNSGSGMALQQLTQHNLRGFRHRPARYLECFAHFLQGVEVLVPTPIIEACAARKGAAKMERLAEEADHQRRKEQRELAELEEAIEFFGIKL